ncbi:hypothetical protein [Oleiagrimonas sp. C23AA]|uniref:hypothetical protein n=1 Tax=Oleiagrimonas sp. C23AA TaxID=2719047 RepID=UPI001422684B|nr:hypothetical protein [Oleiagrimonas sp. C23AA]NII11846.1 hypothetical protein [Oleiagrimonas sp. C23AA]
MGASSGSGGASVEVDAGSGRYVISKDQPDLRFVGSVGAPLTDVRRGDGQDAIGRYRETSFAWTHDGRYLGSIRAYEGSPVVLFTVQAVGKARAADMRFPDFSRMPGAMHHYSFRDSVFSPPVFGKLPQTSTPWLFFDGKDDAYVVSPASQFIVSKMFGDGEKSMAVGLNPELHQLPAHFKHKAILVMGHGIGRTWKQWGQALVRLHHKQVPSNHADDILKYYGYWTDNGADYYYNYDTEKGYAGTLEAIPGEYARHGFKLGYMQLDSWWYKKSIYGVDGKPNAGHKNRRLSTKGTWNRYGGLMEYRADPLVFAHGVAPFQKQLGLPLVTHNRWIDPRSPYHKKYQVTGYAATGMKFWRDMADYLHDSGIVDYEQDWLNFIYSKTPRMASDVSVGNDFADHMAAATKARHIDMQYCMATPRFFLQGAKYSNLTTIRTSDDRFEPKKWRHFIYTSQLAHALGIWPWSDVFKSHETGNMIVSVLSAGPVGTGDALGREDMANIDKAARPDGVLVKPDVPLMPLDSDYLHAAEHEDAPMLAATYTQHGSIRTSYVFAFAPGKDTGRQFHFKPSTLGQQGQVVIYDPLTHASRELAAGDAFSSTLKHGQYAYTYYIVAPVQANGIAFLGDAGKIASTGKTRIKSMHASSRSLTVEVGFGKSDHDVILSGHYQKSIKASRGQLKLDSDTHMFTLRLRAPSSAGTQTVTFTQT